METNPTLTEPGIKYFLRESLKNIHKENIIYNNFLFNFTLLIGFLIILMVLLFYKYKTKPTEEDLKKIEDLKKTYILSKIKALNMKKEQEKNDMITTIPKFESNFELLHKKFYRV
jgi:hypothetical protein